MTGAGAFPFDPERIVALGRLAAQINGAHAPAPLDHPVLVDEDGEVLLPVPGHPDDSHLWVPLEAGLTLQWAPCPEQGGLMLALWPGAAFLNNGLSPIAVFLTADGLRTLINDFQAIHARLSTEPP